MSENIAEEKQQPEKIRGTWKQMRSRLVYDNPWIRLEHHDVKTPADTDGIYGYIHFKNNAVGIIPIDNEGNTWLVKQYRYTLEQETWEIPMGGGPVGTDVLEAAKRELEEETGLIAQQWEQIAFAHVSKSVTDEEGYIFLAQDLSSGKMSLEETEDITVHKISLREAFAMAEDGRITDGLSVIGLLKLKIMLLEKKGVELPPP